MVSDSLVALVWDPQFATTTATYEAANRLTKAEDDLAGTRGRAISSS